jgi:hypothetical protein
VRCRQLDGQSLDCRAPTGELHCGFTRDGEKPPLGDKNDARDSRMGDHGCAGNIKSGRPKIIGGQQAGQAVGRRQRPRLVHQIGERYLATMRPRILSRSHDESGSFVQNLRLQMFLRDRRDDVCNNQVNIAFLEDTELLKRAFVGWVRNRSFAGDQVTNNARMPSREPVDDDGEESG